MRFCLAFGLILILATVGRSDARLFPDRVAPLLRERCLSCHNATKNRGGLDLTSRVQLLAGGNEGPAIVPGKAADSLLYRYVSGPKPRMPKEGPPLTAAEMQTLAQWINEGAVWPATLTLQHGGKKNLVGPDWWSLRPLKLPLVPTASRTDWARTPIDRFILAQLEARSLEPAPKADRRTLIRRVTFDLHGLPPTPEEIDSFVNDAAPDAWDRVIERLLASPRYGERWARHWLDVVHYGDTHGYDKDKRRDQAWPYRDYVIRSLNQDKPYERFLREQVAGDVLFPGNPEGISAVGFLAAGPWDFVGHVELREGTVDKEKTRLIDRDDMLSNTMSTFVSLTVHCARCHDHKFDPIPQQDYYRLQAVFAGLDRGNRPADGTPVYAVIPRAPRPIHLLQRGDVEQPRSPVGPGALSCVPGLPGELAVNDPQQEGSRRVALADWLARPDNVLTWRSIVNRVWHYHFGKGLVDSPNDFGFNGGRPSHPELLDWLAVTFRDGGGSLKDLHRLILRSAVYQQAVIENPAAARVDNDNRLLWRMNRQRLDAEAVRDAVLWVSGKLDSRMGGPGFELFRFKDDHSPIYDHTALEKINAPAAWRRTVYRFVVRSVPNPFLDCLDCADPNANTPVRNTTLTALQALALLNDPFMVKQAEFFAARLTHEAADLETQVQRGVILALGRPPTLAEQTELVRHAQRHGLANVCRLLFNLNAFVFVD